MENLIFLGVPILKHITVDPFYKMDQRFWFVFEGKHLYSRVNTIEFYEENCKTCSAFL